MFSHFPPCASAGGGVAFYKLGRVWRTQRKRNLLLLTEVFCLSSTIHNVFKQRDLKTATSSFLLSWQTCLPRLLHPVHPMPGLWWSLTVQDLLPPFQLSALSPELCCACACLQPCLGSGLWFAVTELVEALWKKHVSCLPCFYWSHSSDLPVAPCCLKAASWQNFVSLSASRTTCVHQLRGFPYSWAPFCVQGMCCRRLEGLPGGKPFMAAAGLVWGQLCYLQGWKLSSHPCEFKKGSLEREAQFPF